MRSTSSFTQGQHLDSSANASLFWYMRGVEGQSVSGALDQVVMAVSGEMLMGADGASSIVVAWGAIPVGDERAAKKSGESHARLSGNAHKELSFKAEVS